MGYDMQFRQEPEGEQLAVAAIQVLFDEAVTARDKLPREEAGTFNFERYKTGNFASEAHELYDGRTVRYTAAHDKVLAASDEVNRTRRSYFRFNVWGMIAACDIMDHVGMIFQDEDNGAYPKPEDFGTTWEERSALKYPDDYSPEEYPGILPWTDERLRAVTRLNEAVEKYLSAHVKADVPGIPDRKFSTNDG